MTDYPPTLWANDAKAEIEGINWPGDVFPVCRFWAAEARRTCALAGIRWDSGVSPSYIVAASQAAARALDAGNRRPLMLISDRIVGEYRRGLAALEKMGRRGP